MTVIALTGGIGSGKSEATKEFAALGIPIVDADVIAHELTATKQPLLNEIRHIFGADFIDAEGTLNRAKLRKHIFDNPAERIKLEALMHPAIHQRALELLADNHQKFNPPYQILAIPLLFENNRYNDVIDLILVIDCDENLQLKRALARGNMTEAEVRAMMRAQTSRATRVNSADEVILNNESITEFHEKIREIHKKFIKTCIVSKYI